MKSNYLMLTMFGSMLTVIGALILLFGDKPTGIGILIIAFVMNLIGGIMKKRSMSREDHNR